MKLTVVLFSISTFTNAYTGLKRFNVKINKSPGLLKLFAVLYEFMLHLSSEISCTNKTENYLASKNFLKHYKTRSCVTI